MKHSIVLTLVLTATAAVSAGGVSSARDPRLAELAQEVRSVGWIVFGARSQKGDWDIFVMRPDGSSLRNITNTPNYSEAWPRFSPDGRRLSYRRLARNEKIRARHGGQGLLVLANSDGTNPTAFGQRGEYPWACWSPDGKNIACLATKGIFFVNLRTKQVTRQLPRKGFFQQLTWSPDGKWVSGVANMGEVWTIARMHVGTGAVNRVHEFQNCTPRWFPDSRRLAFGYRPAGQEGNQYGWTQMYMADANGENPTLVYGEDGVHIYGNMPSPDGRYVVFTRSVEEGGNPEGNGGEMAVMRIRDAPTIGGKSEALRQVHPRTKDGPVLHLPIGWKPYWGYAQFPDTQ